MKRRAFLRHQSSITLGFLGLSAFAAGCQEDVATEALLSEGYGPLTSDAQNVLKLPQGFTYKVISTVGDPMDDGLLVPGAADGMASFTTPSGEVIIIRNHELSPDTNAGPFGAGNSLLDKVQAEAVYDFGHGTTPCAGGTTTVVYNQNTQMVTRQYLSLAGTIRNCAGGPTPWGSWISCEENTTIGHPSLEKDHGYNFEVAATAQVGLKKPLALREMGRFNHEAVCVDPKTGIVYQTEDRKDGLIYRYIPNQVGRLELGGKLQALAILDAPNYETRNWKTLKDEKMEVTKSYAVTWIDLDNPEAPEDDLRLRGFAAGAARFARGEGMWFGDNELYFACTNGGHLGHGQVFRYQPSKFEGTSDESSDPGKLQLFIEPNNTDLLKSCDNLTIAPNGHIVMCEDRPTPRIVGVSPKGDIYHIAENIGYKTEFAGGCFSPDGRDFFVNIQGAGLTLAIRGPWADVAV